MAELRKDYILEKYCIIASSRGKRPQEFAEAPADKHVDQCFFCPGNENMTPPEIGRVGDENGWKIRWFQNKFSAVDSEGQVELRTDNDFFTFANAVGHHEVIVETPEHSGELHTLPPEHMYEVFKVFSDRIDAVTEMAGVKYAILFKNHGRGAGTSIKHTHSQLIGYNQIPPHVMEKVEAIKNHVVCPYCRIIDIERNSHRSVAENNSFVAFTPYASTHPFELWIFPKRHIRMLHELTDNEFMDLATLTGPLLAKLATLNASYNIAFQQSPTGHDMHLHIEILPRIGTWGGFELGTSTIINSMPPEEAAKFYRGEE